MNHTRGFLIGRFGLIKGETQIENSKGYIYQYYTSMEEVVRVMCDMDFSANENPLSANEKIGLLKQLMQIKSVMFGDNLLGENMNAVQYCYTIAALYLQDNYIDEALNYLEAPLDYAEKFETYIDDKCYTTPILSGLKTLPHSHWSQSAFKDLENEFSNSKFNTKYKLLDGNLRYNNIIAVIKKKAN